MQLAGLGVLVRVCGVAGREVARPKGPLEVGGADGVELLGGLVRRRPGLDQRQRLPGVGEDVGVGREVPDGPVLARLGLTQLSRDGVRAHVAVAVPLRLAVDDADAVHHAVAEEPVVVLAGIAQRVGTDAQVAPVEMVGDGPGHRQVGHGLLLAHRREVVLEVAVGHGDPFLLAEAFSQRLITVL